jgi:glyoxylase-like metal-dependent hydrolase (beta-lactamase superfamily II)
VTIQTGRVRTSMSRRAQPARAARRSTRTRGGSRSLAAPVIAALRSWRTRGGSRSLAALVIAALRSWRTRGGSRSLAALVIAALLSWTAAAEAQLVRTADPGKRGLADADFPRVTRLADGVYAYEQLRSAGDERFTTVSLFVVTAAGVLVADGQGSEAETKRLIEEIGKITPQPVTHVVIGSDHGDHTAGNAAFPAGAAYYAHPTSIEVLEAAARRRREAGVANPVAYTPVRDRTVLRLGGTEIHVLFLGRAHTGGDLSVYLPSSKVLFMSEAYLHRVFPAMRSAYPSEWVQVIEKAQALDVDVYVPGHGFVDPPGVLEEELETFRRALVQVIAEAKRLHAAGVGVDDAVTQARFGDLAAWSLRASQAPIAIRRIYLELEGRLPK